ncbi:Alpha/beta hydrolase fold-1 [Mycena belliarum]|uniref:Alpha/beta hydrolase fold-1 n=1 Tax=Mycena belliarum TaxID=1033014 RepID=A0AAD6TVH8_9AGAR|nr:Alpha/beta hydrolase fold-1 [Mycena belliae]
MLIEATPIVFDCPQNAKDAPGNILKLSVKRYCTLQSAGSPNGLTLLFAHCVGAHKEQWEPTIQRIFELRGAQVHEAWALDWQTHGDSAVLNQKLLETSPSRVYGVSASEWAEGIAAFLRSAHMHGKRIVAVGHSAGAGAMVLPTQEFSLTALPYAALVLIEPTIITREHFYRNIDDRVATMEFVVAATAARRTRWRSREEAQAWLARRIPWDSWDARVVRLLSTQGLADEPGGGVVLKCAPNQEALAYADTAPHFAAAEQLGLIARAVPVHLVWASDSLVPDWVQDSFGDGSGGRVAASTATIEGAHQIVQENPDAVADAICAVLDTLRALRPRL